MHGTSSEKSAAPLNAGTTVPTCAHRKLRVVAAQRSGAPNSSTSRSRVGVVVAALGRVELQLRGERDRVHVARRRGRSTRRVKRSVGAAACATGSAPSTSNPARVDRRAQRPPPAASARRLLESTPPRRRRDAGAARDPLPGGLHDADQPVGGVDRDDHVLRRVGEAVDDQRLGVGLELGAPGWRRRRRPRLQVQLGLGRARRARVQRDHAPGDRADHEEREPDRDRNAAHCSSVSCKSSSHTRAVADRAELGVAGAQRPARRAHAHDPPLLEVDRCLCSPGDPDRAQLAGLLVRRVRGRPSRRRRRRAARGRERRAPAIGSRIAAGRRAVGGLLERRRRRPAGPRGPARQRRLERLRIPQLERRRDAGSRGSGPRAGSARRRRRRRAARRRRRGTPCTGRTLSSASRTRVLERHRVEPVHQQQARDRAVVERGASRSASEPSSATASKIRSRPSP